MKFAEAAERLRLARLEGKRQTFSCCLDHFTIGVNDSYFWWEYVCCDDPECYNGDFETYETVEALISGHGDRAKEWDDDWS